MVGSKALILPNPGLRAHVDVMINAREYRFMRSTISNIERRVDGLVVEHFCIARRGRLPTEDVALAQLLLLETDEPDFRRIANSYVIEHDDDDDVA